MTASAPLTGRMSVVCMECSGPIGFVPCVPEMDGKVSHGVCLSCAPAYQAKIEALFFGLDGRENHQSADPKKEESV